MLAAEARTRRAVFNRAKRGEPRLRRWLHAVCPVAAEVAPARASSSASSFLRFRRFDGSASRRCVPTRHLHLRTITNEALELAATIFRP